MSVTNELLGNQDFVATALKSLIEQEFKRVVETGLVSKADCFKFIEKQQDGFKSLLAVYAALSNIKLAGDKLNEEPFYDLKSILDKIKELKNQELPKQEKECSCDPGQCAGTDCPCPEDCQCKDQDRLMVKLEQLDTLISERLEKVAYAVGKNGDHDTAYLVERTLKDIKSKIRNGSLEDKKDDTKELAERNKVLIIEADKLLKEFSNKFPNATYLHFVKAIRAEMRKAKESDPLKTANVLRNVWNS